VPRGSSLGRVPYSQNHVPVIRKRPVQFLKKETGKKGRLERGGATKEGKRTKESLIRDFQGDSLNCRKKDPRRKQKKGSSCGRSKRDEGEKGHPWQKGQPSLFRKVGEPTLCRTDSEEKSLFCRKHTDETRGKKTLVRGTSGGGKKGTRGTGKERSRSLGEEKKREPHVARDVEKTTKKPPISEASFT